MTDAELEQFGEAMARQREELLVALAEDLGGDPADYRIGPEPVPDAGDG